jgi:hypothetical protein
MGLNSWQQVHDQGHDHAFPGEILSISLFPYIGLGLLDRFA